MSVSVFFSVMVDRKLVQCLDPSDFRRAMGVVFGGDPPWRLGVEHRNELRAMSAALPDGRNAYRELADAINKYGVIQVTMEHK